MIQKLIISIQDCIVEIEEAVFTTLFFYGCMGYLTIYTIALSIKAIRDDLLDPVKMILFLLSYCLLTLFYYARYKMIVDDENDEP